MRALYLVCQYPKPNKRGLVTMNVIVEANSGADAIRQAVAIGEDGTSEKWFGPDPCYCAPKAKALKPGVCFTT